MQGLKEDMSRLHREIAVSRKARQRLMRHLAEFRRSLRDEVADTLAQQHAATAKRFALAREVRATFVQGVARQVGAMCAAWRAERMDARRAWHG